MISILVIGLFAAGIPLGFLIKERTFVLSIIERLINLVILALLFFLGISVGNNPKIIENFSELGWQAIWLSTGALLGSLILALLVTRFFKKENSTSRESTAPTPSGEDKKLNPGRFFLTILTNQSFWVLFFFLAGILGSLTHLIPSIWGDSRLTTLTLYCLMSLVGISTGGDQRALKVLKHIRFGVILVPFIVVFGSLAGSALFSLWLKDISTANAMAVGAGFGYYSLSGIFIGQISGEEMGVIALLANLFREIITLVAAPLMVRHFGTLGAIVSGGATAMDTTLPVIVKTTGKEYAIVAIFSGIVLTVLVPILVPFILEFL